MKTFAWIAALGGVGLGLLWLPPGVATSPVPSRDEFVWNQDELFAELEKNFIQQSEKGCAEPNVAGSFVALEQTASHLGDEPRGPRHAYWNNLERHLFDAGVVAAACPGAVQRFAEIVPQVQEGLRVQALAWDLDMPASRARLYRLRYGLRAAYEEALLRVADDTLTLTHGVQDKLAVPTIELHGVQIQSGDILVSRGGAPTSALIARGNDRPGNFSHVALVHVSEEGKASVIESHIESGVGVFSSAQYLKDKKLRIMVLRLAPDHPALQTAPGLPHEVATRALEQASREPPGYDFQMNYDDPSKMFCSEVVYDAYRAKGVFLWRALSSLSGPAAGSWLASLGVEHFDTLAPSDLEYDPQLRVVAEWRNPETLLDDHIDNAVIDGLLSRAKLGLSLDYDMHKLGLARLVKGYSAVLNAFGKVGPIPKGMSAATGLRVERLRVMHGALRKRVEARLADYQKANGYPAPYWTMVSIAEREAEALFVL